MSAQEQRELFAAATGCDVGRAQFYIDNAGGDLEVLFCAAFRRLRRRFPRRAPSIFRPSPLCASLSSRESVLRELARKAS